MTTLRPELAPEIAAACQSNAGEIAAALTRAFAGEFSVTVGEPMAQAAAPLPEDLASAGLAIWLLVNDQAAVIVLPEACGLIPSWYAQPDATGQSKLTTLAQELSMLVLPDTVATSQFGARRCLDLAKWLARGELASEAALLPLLLSDSAGRQGVALLLWPLANPATLLGAETAEMAQADAVVAAADSPKPASRRIPAADVHIASLTEEELPSYSKSLLRIQVPVTVTLAEKRQAVGRIVELGPGSIIQFDKPCEEQLELEVGGHKIGKGEAVKVGDKFGLRLTSLIVPEERFVSVRRAARS